MAYDQAVQAKQRANLLTVFNQSEFTDVTFIVGNNEQKTSFQANRVFLASISPVFKAMLYGSMQESKQNAEIEINDVEPNAFKCILKYAYCNDPELTTDNIFAVRIISDKYQISSLLELCDKYFSSCLNAQNVCLLLSKSISLKLDTYVKECFNSIKVKLGKSANEIVNSPGFLTMSTEAMILFLQINELNIKEENIWTAVLKWLDKQAKDPYENYNGQPPANKKQKLNNGNTNNKVSNNTMSNNTMPNNKLNLLKRLCPYIRFGLMNSEYFVRNVRSLNCLTANEMTDILCYMQCKEQGCGTFVTTPRIGTVAIGDEWDPTLIGKNCVLNGNSVKHTSLSNSLFSSCFGKKVVKYNQDGKYHWKFKIKGCGSGRGLWRIVIGVWKMKGNVSKPANLNTHFTGNSSGYAIDAMKAKKLNRSGDAVSVDKYGTECKIGDVYDMYLDYSKLTLSFSINGTDMGVAFSGIEKIGYRAAVSTRCKGVEIQML